MKKIISKSYSRRITQTKDFKGICSLTFLVLVFSVLKIIYPNLNGDPELLKFKTKNDEKKK